jgi:hypothetical protein
MPGRDHQGPTSFSGWVSVAASISVAAAVVGFCWEDVQSASSAVQNKISRNLRKSLGVVTSSFKSGLSGVAALEDDDVLKDTDVATLSGVKRKRKALQATSRESIRQEPQKGIAHPKTRTETHSSKSGSSARSVQGLAGSRKLRKNDGRKRKNMIPVKRVPSSISESLDAFMSPSSGGKQSCTASNISTPPNDGASSNHRLVLGGNSDESANDESAIGSDLESLEPTQKSSMTSNTENIDRDIVTFFEATSPCRTLSSQPHPPREPSEATGSSSNPETDYNKVTGSPRNPDSEHSELSGAPSGPDIEPSEATYFATNEFTHGRLVGGECMLESGSIIDSNSKHVDEFTPIGDDQSSLDAEGEKGSDSDPEKSDAEYSDSETGPIHIAAVEPGKWIAIPGEEDDGTTTTWMAQVLAYKSRNVITVRYLREVESASEIADVQAYYDEINDILKKARNRCFVFYETRTYKKVFREGYVNLKSTPFVILRSNEVQVHLTWDEALKSRNCLVSFVVTQVRLAKMKQTLYAVLDSE